MSILDIENGAALTPDQVGWLIDSLPQAKQTLDGHGADIAYAAKKWRINPLFLLAIARHESHFGTDYANNPSSSFGKGKNMAGLDYGTGYAESGTPAIGKLSVYSGQSQHTIALFSEWWHSLNAQAWLLRTKYLDKGLTNASDILHKYSPHSDGNDPDAYAVDVLTYMAKWAAMLPTPPKEENVGNPTVEQTLAKAQADVGIHEHNNDNRTSINAWFGSGWQGQPYCAMGVSKWLITSGFKIKKNAGAHELSAELIKDYGWKKVAAKDVRKGDVVQFTWSHIGICKKRIDANRVLTIEANSGDGGVHEITRGNSEIAYGIRPPYGASVVTPPPVTTPTPPNTFWATLRRDTQPWNQTIGTKRNGGKPWAKGGKVLIFKGRDVKKGTKTYWYGEVGGKGAWVLSDDVIDPR